MPETISRNSLVTERSLAILAIGAVLGFCWLARELLLPTVLALFLAFTLQPLVAWLEAHRIPRPLAALLGTLLATLVVAVIAALLYDRISSFVQELPGYEDRIRAATQALFRRYTHLRAQSDQLAATKPQPGTVKVQESVPLGQLLLGTAQGALAAAAAVTLAVFVLYFALAEGPRYRRKLLEQAGETAGGRERLAAALAEIQRDLSSYLVNRIVLNAILGAVMAGVYALYGLEHAVVWGLTTALLHFVPYVGPALGIVLPSAMALLQYGTAGHVLAVAGIYTALVGLQGNVVDPIFLGKQLRLNSLAVFLGSIFWFWIWGPVGLFLAVPLLSTLRIACSHIPRARFVAAFLAE
ncbi:AI-2E family transporter [Anaeromyxobacter paludicola]|uniref:AI-2E family transporter n=1 Tax=Anaeromyxobacter paludicola TaxID=2918171 RepID=UPI0020BED728|nr:AI-2E family transporter [Anaeromyxobacter paludicola]